MGNLTKGVSYGNALSKADVVTISKEMEMKVQSILSKHIGAKVEINIGPIKNKDNDYSINLVMRNGMPAEPEFMSMYCTIKKDVISALNKEIKDAHNSRA